MSNKRAPALLPLAANSTLQQALSLREQEFQLLILASWPQRCIGGIAAARSACAASVPTHMGTHLALTRPNLLQQIPVVNQLIFSALKMGATACVHSRALEDVLAVGSMVASAFLVWVSGSL